MAVSLPLGLPVISFSPPTKTLHSIQLKPTIVSDQFKPLNLRIITKRSQNRNFTKINAIEEGRQENESETVSTEQTNASAGGDGEESVSRPGEVSELGLEIKKAMEERKRKEAEGGGGDLWSGVAAEVREIEWPVFGKVLGTTGVVLGVIAGSSVVLLTVNAVLAELSDRVFAGKGVQDFFS